VARTLGFKESRGKENKTRKQKSGHVLVTGFLLSISKSYKLSDMFQIQERVCSAMVSHAEQTMTQKMEYIWQFIL